MAWTTDIQDIPLPTNVSKPVEPSTPVTPSLRFIRLPEVKHKTTLCRSAILALPGFPKPVQLGGSRAKAWIESEVVQWMKEQAAKRQSVGAK